MSETPHDFASLDTLQRLLVEIGMEPTGDIVSVALVVMSDPGEDADSYVGTLAHLCHPAMGPRARHKFLHMADDIVRDAVEDGHRDDPSLN